MEVLIIDNNNYGPQRPNRQSEDLVNELIRFPEMLVIDQNGTSLGVKSRYDALRIAREAQLDLLCVAPMAKPPVCKIVNYGKHRFEQQKKARETRKNQKVVETKEVRFTPQTDQHDLEVKAKATIKWLAEGNRVKVTVRYRGRQMAHMEIGAETMKRFLALIEEVAQVEKEPVVEGRHLFAFIAPKKK
jgi:translation initiation factor IF-3